MQGREYLELAREILPGGQERHWRGAAGRGYYAIFLECRERLAAWGFAPPPRMNVHMFLRLRFTYPADADLQRIGKVLDRLVQLRNRADYNLGVIPEFASVGKAQRAIQEADDSIALLDAIEADPTRRSAAIAALTAAFP